MTTAARRRRSGVAIALSAFLLAACSTAGGGQMPSSPAATTSGETAPTGALSMPTTPAGEADGPTEQTPDPSTLTVPESASGETDVVDVPGQDSEESAAPGRTVRYTVEVEKGLEEVAGGFPEAVRRDLTHPRGWQTADGVRFVNVSPKERRRGAETDIRIQFASPRLVDRVCAPLRTNGRLSCHHRGKVMINAWRWVHGSKTYGDDLERYRVYLVNHEVGHSLGHNHLACPSSGALAPIMLQQTLRLEGCRPNPYPVREGR